MIYMDMSKAFDKVDHEVLRQNLQKDYGFGGNLLRWFRCYLENRKQKRSNVMSNVRPTSHHIWCTARFNTWSNIIPPLRQLICQVPRNVKSSRVAMFADDTKVFKAIYTIANRLMMH